MKYDIVALYVCIDDFSKIYEEWKEQKLIGATKNRKREGKLSMREKRNKVFGKIAEKGKTSMGWFFGFKLYMIINNIGQIMAIKITKGNVDYRTACCGANKGTQGLYICWSRLYWSCSFQSFVQKRLKAYN